MKIRQIIDKIDENQLFVPAFQREYVWKRNDAKNLMDSLIKDYPTGTLLTWETNHPPELKGTYKYEPTKGAVKIILDGQQRITTLYMLMTGDIPPYYTEHDIENDIRSLYVNIQTLELEYYKVKLMENNPLWIKLTNIFRNIVRERDITDSLENKNGGARLPRELETKISDNLHAIKKINDREFLEQVIPVKAKIKEAIDIFYIVNASGVSLTDAELALAQISGYWAQARELFKAKLLKLEKNGWVFKLDFIVYALLAVTHKMGSKMEKLHTEDNKERLIEAWGKLDGKVLDYVCNLLQSQAYVDHTDEINSVYALIPIIAYVFNKQSNKLNEEEIKKVIKWFYYSQIRFRYISQLPQKLDKDISIVNENPKPFDALLALIEEERPLEIKASEFIGRDVRHPLFSLMKWYFKSKGAICLGTGLKLRKNMGKKYSLEKDHIFAYSLLRDSGIYDMDNQFHYALAQEITNRAILTQTENRTKLDKDPATYLRIAKEQFPTALKLQCIPEEESLWKIEKYEAFLQKRRDTLAENLNEFLNSITISEQEIITHTDIVDMIQSGENSFLEYKSTMRWNWRENKLDKKMEEIILKTISAFSNADGGKLLIGVTDEGEILGLESDYNSLKEPNKDHFELHLRNLVNDAFGKEYAATQLSVRFPIINDLEICEIDIKSGLNPIFLCTTDKNGAIQKKFYIRSGNTSQELNIEEASSYISKHFNNK
jgi:uncharacterized protein with ParB-like and HNH nuclease domain